MDISNIHELEKYVDEGLLRGEGVLWAQDQSTAGVLVGVTGAIAANKTPLVLTKFLYENDEVAPDQYRVIDQFSGESVSWPADLTAEEAAKFEQHKVNRVLGMIGLLNTSHYVPAMLKQPSFLEGLNNFSLLSTEKWAALRR
jgi:hypothetical protein